MLVPGRDQAFPRKNFQCLVLITHFCNIAGILKSTGTLSSLLYLLFELI